MYNHTQISIAVNDCLLQQRLLQHKVTAGIMALGLALSIACQAKADTYTVTNINASGPGSFSEALALANSDPDHDIINLSNVSGDIQAPGGFPQISESVDIIGPGPNQLSINTKLLFFPENYYNQNRTHLISGLKLNGGISFSSGIQFHTAKAVLDNVETHRVDIYSDSVTIKNSKVTNGRGISISRGHLTIKDSHINMNYEAVGARTSTIVIEDTIISGNEIAGRFRTSNTVLRNSTVTNNNVGLSGADHFQIENSTISGNGSTGLSVTSNGYYSKNGTATIINSTISDNNGNGITSQAKVTKPGLEIINSTISNNKGIGLAFVGELATIQNSTIVNNQGGILNSPTLAYGGYFDSQSGNVTAINTIIAGNSYNGIGDLSGETPISLTNSIVQETTPVEFIEVIPGSNLINVDPLIGSLQDNSGSTQTHALLAGSPAVDNGDDASCPAVDQRGIIRPQGPNCDIGAYEVETTITPLPAELKLTATINGNDTLPKPGSALPNSGSPANWQYSVTNSGDETASRVRLYGKQIEPVPDSKWTLLCVLGNITGSNTASCSSSSLIADGPAKILLSAQGRDKNGKKVIIGKPAWYVGGADTNVPALSLEVLLNGADDDNAAPGVDLTTGDIVVYTYYVTNTGPFTLANVRVFDRNRSPVKGKWQRACVFSTIAPAQTVSCKRTITAASGAIRRNVTVQSRYASQRIKDDEASYYRGK